MGLQEAIILIVAGVGVMLGAVGASAKYLLGRLQKLEAKEETSEEKLRLERDSLLERVADLEERVKRVPILEAQVQTLITQMGSMTERMAEQDQENTVLKTENRRLEKELSATDARNQELEIENRTFRQVFTLMGIERLEAEKPNKEPVSTKVEPAPVPVAAGEGPQPAPTESETETNPS